MKKYLTVYKTEFLHFLQYRSEFIAEFISIFITLFITLYFALAVYEHKDEIYGYTLSEFASYALLTRIIQYTVDTDIAGVLPEDIKKGSLATTLLKPIRYNVYRLFAELSWKTHALFYNGITLGLLTILYASVFDLQIITSRIPLFILALILGYFLNRAFRFLTGVIAFWTKDTSGLSNFIREIMGLLGGSWLPLDFLGIFASVLKILPFSYIFYFPIQLLINSELTNTDILRILVLELAWMVCFTLLGFVLWKRGLKQFESVGI